MARRSYLADQTSMSTITVTASTPEKYVAPPSALQDAGFLAGLTGGWHALGGATYFSGVEAVTVIVDIEVWSAR